MNTKSMKTKSMKMKKLFLISGSLLAFAFGSTWMLAQAHPGREAGHPGFQHGGASRAQHGLMGRQFRGLNLTEQQKQQMHETMHGNQASRDELRVLRESLHQLGTSDNFNAAEAQTIAVQIGELTTRMEMERVEAVNQMYLTLDSEQKATLATMLEHRSNRSWR